MSMWLDVVVMSQRAFELVKGDEDLLDDVFQQETAALAKLGIATSDLGGCDYRVIDDAVTAMGEDTGDDAEASFDEEGSLEYEGTYGPAMFWSPETLAKALDSDGWQMAIASDDAMAALMTRATNEKLWVIAVIN